MTERTNKFFTGMVQRRNPLCRFVSGKNAALLCLALAGGMLSTTAKAAACYATAGQKTYNFNMSYLLADPTQNSAGRVINNAYQWNLSGNYNVTCSCSGTYTGAYITAKVPDTGQVYSDGNLNYYAINEYLAVASEVFIGGNYQGLKATPFTSDQLRQISLRYRRAWNDFPVLPPAIRRCTDDSSDQSRRCVYRFRCNDSGQHAGFNRLDERNGYRSAIMHD